VEAPPDGWNPVDGRALYDALLNGQQERQLDQSEHELQDSDDTSDSHPKDLLGDAVIGSPGVSTRNFNILPNGMAEHDGVHVMAPLGGNPAQVVTLPSLVGKVVYWNVQEGQMGKPGALYTVRVESDNGKFFTVYKDLASVSSAITSKLPAGTLRMNSKVRLGAGDAIGTIPGIDKSDPQNKSRAGLHVTFVRPAYFKAFSTSTKKDNSATFGSLNPAYYFINPCSSESRVRCR
jgi:hypothetical protein